MYYVFLLSYYNWIGSFFANLTLFTAGENVEATAESASSKNQEAVDEKEEQTANNQSNEDDTTGEQSEPPPAEATEAANSSEDTTETDSSAAQLTSEQQRTYANLQPIFLAMEMGQEAVNQVQEQNQENTAVEIGQQQAAYIATTSEQFTQPSQGASMLLSNVTTSGSEPPASLASILQDVVSGMQSGTGTVPAAIITDPNSGSGSFLIVNQNGVPIVRPVLVSNLPAGGVGQGGAVSVSAETLQVLTAGLHAVDDGSAGSGQETVTVDVSAETEGTFWQNCSVWWSQGCALQLANRLLRWFHWKSIIMKFLKVGSLGNFMLSVLEIIVITCM